VGKVVLDASVILALFDPEDALHAAAATAARQRRDDDDTFILPATVLAEILVGAARIGQDQLERHRSLTVTAFGSPWPVDEAVAVAAAVRRARHRSLRLPDAMVLATADVAGADAVLTGDKRWRELDPRVNVVA
jgi:predicted nucleic acid-binding protein